MGIGLSTMDRWARQLRDDRNGGAGSGAPISEEQRKIRELEKRVKLLELEKDILKKASALLISDSLNGLRRSKHYGIARTFSTCAVCLAYTVAAIVTGLLERRSSMLRERKQ